MVDKPINEIIEQARQLLDREWSETLDLGGRDELHDWLEDSELRGAISRSINSNTKTYRYVLPTQLVSKLVEPSLDCRSLQAADRSSGTFDARSIADHVIVPFDQHNHNVLGGRPNPM